MNVTIDESMLDQVPATADLRRAMIAELDDEDLDRTSPGWRARHVAFYAERIARGRAAILLAHDRSACVGMAAVYEVDNHRSAIFGQRSAYVSSVYVVPEARRRGVASALMHGVTRWAREHGCRVLRLRSSGPGAALYAALGFRATTELELPLETIAVR